MSCYDANQIFFVVMKIPFGWALDFFYQAFDRMRTLCSGPTVTNPWPKREVELPFRSRADALMI